MGHRLTYNSNPIVTLGTNTFINVPTIIKFDDIPLIQLIKKKKIKFKTEISIYHPDGTYLAKVSGNRIFPTKDGRKAGVKMRYIVNMSVCEMNGATFFEIKNQPGAGFRTTAELYTPNGFFIKWDDVNDPQLIRNNGNQLQVGNVLMSGCVFRDVSVGIWLKSDGSCAIGCA